MSATTSSPTCTCVGEPRLTGLPPNPDCPIDGELPAAFGCPICGLDTEHSHSRDEFPEFFHTPSDLDDVPF